LISGIRALSVATVKSYHIGGVSAPARDLSCSFPRMSLQPGFLYLPVGIYEPPSDLRLSIYSQTSFLSSRPLSPPLPPSPHHYYPLAKITFCNTLPYTLWLLDHHLLNDYLFARLPFLDYSLCVPRQKEMHHASFLVALIATSSVVNATPMLQRREPVSMNDTSTLQLALYLEHIEFALYSYVASMQSVWATTY